MSNVIDKSNEQQSIFLPYYRSLLPKSVLSEGITPKKTSKRCSSSYRQRLKRIKTNCQLIRQRRRRTCPFPIPSIELRPSLFQQRFYQTGSLESLNISQQHWQSTNFLRLSNEYLYKCKYAMYSSANRSFKQKEFHQFLQEFFSCWTSREEKANSGSFTCQLCQSQFSTNTVFNLHLNRRSVVIQYRCLTCQSWINSTNPCQAYDHLLLHTNSPRDKCIEQLSVSSDEENCRTFIDDIFASYSD